MLLLLLLLHSKLVISPTKLPFIPAGSSTQFKANVPVHWSLGAGSPGSIDQDGVYHAPVSVPVKNNLAGCQVLPNDHIFNTRVDALTVHARSPGWIAGLAPGRISYYESWGTNISDNSTPREPMHFLYSPENDGVYEIPKWPSLKRENGVFTISHSEVDRHVITVDKESCQFFELYNNYPAGENEQCATCTAQGGAKYSGMSYALPTTSSDAAGLLIAPLTIHLSEIRSGSIQHAARFTLGNKFISPSAAWPGRAHANAWGTIPYGSRFRLRSGFDLAPFSPVAKVLLTELKEYGMLLADGGANWEIQTSTDVTLDAEVEAAFQEIRRKGPQSSDMEVVDESGLLVSENSGRVNAASSGRVTIVATEMAKPDNQVELSIPLQGITVGVPSPAVWIQSGVKTHLAAWVNGTQDKRLTWSLKPALGTLSPSGDYVAPAVQKPTTVMASAASGADPNATAVVALTVMPPGAIRISVGNATRAPGTPNRSAPDYGPDSEGHMWWRAQAGEVSWGVTNDDWSGEPWPRQKDISLFYTSRYSFGDMIYSFLVPNGNYKISFYFAQPQCKDKYPKEWHAPIHVEAQGQIVLRDFDIGSSIHYACLTPAMQSIPASVQDNSLYFALRRVTTPKTSPSPLMSAFSIVPDNSAPHLAIDPAEPQDMEAGDRVHLYSVGWYMSNQASWSLKGSGSISSDGVYTSPLIPPKSDQPVIIEARSKSDPGKTAAVKFMLRTGQMTIAPAQATTTRTLSQPFKITFGHAPYTNVSWSLNPDLGSINADGVYTAPASLDKDTEVAITGRSKDLPDHQVSAKVMVKVAPDTIRIHCGEGPAFKDAQGRVWDADRGASDGVVRYREHVTIADASPDMQYLYNSATYRYQDEPFNYHFDVPNGRYSVTLKFADYAHNEPGHYSFDVSLNGKKVLQHYDPDREKGSKHAVDKTFETVVTNKSIRLDFIASLGAAFINGIEINYLGPH